MSISSFKIFSLPTVALKETLKSLNPIELYELSQCSQKTAASIRLIGGRYFKLNLLCVGFVEVNEFVFQSLKACKENETQATGTRKFDERLCTILPKSKTKLVTVWENQYIGFLSIFYHLSRLFNCPTNMVCSYYTTKKEHFNTVMKLIIDHQKDIRDLLINAKDLIDEDVTFVLKNIKITEDFQIGVELPGNFKIDKTILSSFKSCSILKSSWVNLDALLSMENAVLIRLTQSSLTNQDMNQFFREWRRGAMPKLEYMLIESTSINGDLKIDGLNQLENTSNPSFEKKLVFRYERLIVGAVPIQREDGTIAKFRYDVNKNCLEFLLV